MKDETKKAGTKPKSGVLRKVGKVVTFPFGDLRQVGDVGRATASLVRQAHTPGRYETFHDAMERLGLTLADADERAVQLRRMGRIYAGTAAIALLLIALAPLSSVPLAQFLGAFAVMVMSGANALVAYFRVAQIRDRALYGFVSWLRGVREADETEPSLGEPTPAEMAQQEDAMWNAVKPADRGFDD